jgi:predicted RNase H-related nuclease YkuK (DUF458 family)
MILKELDIDEVKDYIKAQSPETKVYLGADSERHKINGEWFADYITAVVVHIDGEHGCKVFGGVKRERDYDQKKNKPAMRLMNEVYSVAEIFEALKDVLEDRYVEVHLDLNPDLRYGSSCVVQQAVGYIKGVCGISPMIKPNSWAASHCADRYKDLM